MKKIELTDIKFRDLIPQGGLFAFVSFTLNNSFYCSGIGLHSSPSSPTGWRLTYPKKTLKNGQSISLFNPLDSESGACVLEQVLSAYEQHNASKQNL